MTDYVFAGILIVFLLASHYACRYLVLIPGFSRRRFSSFAGGIAASYVFLHMLPELVESRDRIHVLLDRVTIMSPFKDLIVFVIALLGFELFYSLERFTSNASLTKKVEHKQHFILNLSMYGLYNFLITYTMMERIEVGSIYAVLFTIAIALHFIICDNHFRRYFPKLFNVKGHLVLLAALLLGYLGSIIYPVNIYAFALITAFLSGAILYNTFSEEIALNRQTSIAMFFTGSAIMAVLLGYLLIH